MSNKSDKSNKTNDTQMEDIDDEFEELDIEELTNTITKEVSKDIPILMKEQTKPLVTSIKDINDAISKLQTKTTELQNIPQISTSDLEKIKTAFVSITDHITIVDQKITEVNAKISALEKIPAILQNFGINLETLTMEEVDKGMQQVLPMLSMMGVGGGGNPLEMLTKKTPTKNKTNNTQDGPTPKAKPKQTPVSANPYGAMNCPNCKAEIDWEDAGVNSKGNIKCPECGFVSNLYKDRCGERFISQYNIKDIYGKVCPCCNNVIRRPQDD